MENGVLVELDATTHSSYSFFPSSRSKQDIQMKVYERHIANYKLKCDVDPEKSLKKLIEE